MATAGGMWALLTSCYIYFTSENIRKLLSLINPAMYLLNTFFVVWVIDATVPELCQKMWFFPEKEDKRKFCLCSRIYDYMSTSLCQTCLSRIHGICRSDHPFPSISPILLCISNLFMSNLAILKSRLYRSGSSLPKISFRLLYHYLCRCAICVGQKIKQYEFQTK